jgi:hypothetical protein
VTVKGVCTSATGLGVCSDTLIVPRSAEAALAANIEMKMPAKSATAPRFTRERLNPAGIAPDPPRTVYGVDGLIGKLSYSPNSHATLPMRITAVQYFGATPHR